MFRFTIRELVLVTVVSTLLAPPACADEKNEPAQALRGEWEIVEMIFKGKVQNFGNKPGGWIRFENDSFTISYGTKSGSATKYPCVIRPREFDIQMRTDTVKALYELTDDKLRIIWHSGYGERPTDFDSSGFRMGK